MLELRPSKLMSSNLYLEKYVINPMKGGRFVQRITHIYHSLIHPRRSKYLINMNYANLNVFTPYWQGIFNFKIICSCNKQYILVPVSLGYCTLISTSALSLPIILNHSYCPGLTGAESSGLSLPCNYQFSSPGRFGRQHRMTTMIR